MTQTPPPGRGPGGIVTRLLKRAALLAVVVALCLLALEGLTRVIYNRSGMHFGIEMWKYAKALKRTSPNPDMGHEHVPNREAFLMGVQVKINSDGLRDREYSKEKPDDTYRILVLGDSTTFGWGVPQDETYAKFLERKLNDSPPGKPHHFEVINTGVGNYNTAQEVAYFKERGRQYHPDMVILGFFVNDAEPTPRKETGWLARESALYVFMSSALDGVLRESHRRPNYREYYLSLYEDSKPGWAACQKAIRDLTAECAAEHIDLRVALIPELHTLGADYEFRSVHDKVRGLAREGNVPVIDLLDGLAGQEPTTLWVSPGDPHPNAKAQELFAAQLYTVLASDSAPAGGSSPTSTNGHCPDCP